MLLEVYSSGNCVTKYKGYERKKKWKKCRITIKKRKEKNQANYNKGFIKNLTVEL